ncbi:MAG: hypothetical protein FWG87_04425 [Defluviitaleaceae bacterium]|nr:hypothetical protein [Defluviitaleaceae bacterium]
MLVVFLDNAAHRPTQSEATSGRINPSPTRRFLCRSSHRGTEQRERGITGIECEFGGF